MRIDLIQIASPDDESISDRRERVGRMVLSSKADFVVLPELWAVGYNNFSSYSIQAERLDGRTITDAANWARQLNAYVHAGSFVEDAGNGRFHNTTALLAPSGELIHVYRKVHVFGYKSEEAALLDPGTISPPSRRHSGLLERRRVTTCASPKYGARSSTRAPRPSSPLPPGLSHASPTGSFSPPRALSRIRYSSSRATPSVSSEGSRSAVTLVSSTPGETSSSRQASKRASIPSRSIPLTSQMCGKNSPS